MNPRILLLLALCACARPLAARIPATATELYALYATKDFFALAERLPDLDAGDPRRGFFAGQVDAAFLRDEQAERELQQFIAADGSDPEWQREAWHSLGNLRLRHGDYPGAERALTQALHGSTANFAAARKLDAAQNLALAHALATVPAQTTSAHGPPAKLPVRRDAFGLLHLDVRINGQPDRGMFDTLANGNVASETFAKQHGLRMLKDRVNLTAITGKVLDAREAVADEVRIGGMSFRHVAFTILPGRSLTLPGSGESSSLIIGLPLIMGLERVRYEAGRGEMEVGVTPDNAAARPVARNLAFDGLTPLTRVRYQTQELPFVFDSGARASYLSVRFGQRFPQAMAEAKPSRLHEIGAGSSATLAVRKLPGIGLAVGGVAVRLQDVTALMGERSFLPPVFGTLGADFARDGFELDFRAMRFSLVERTTRR